MDICTNAVKVILVDDHEFARQGIKKFLDSDKSIEIMGEASTYYEAISLIEQHQPDVLLLDIRLKEGNGIDVAKFVRANMPQIKILVLTAHNDDQYVKAMLKIGVNGYLIKTVSAEQLRKAIHDVAEGNLTFPADISSKVINLLQINIEKGNNGLRGDIKNSCKHADVFLHDGSCISKEAEASEHTVYAVQNHEVATSIGIAGKAIGDHTRHILRKLGYKNRIQAVLSGNTDK